MTKYEVENYEALFKMPLAPCPLCGCEVHGVYSTRDFSSICCPRCGLYIRSQHANTAGARAMITIWNTRSRYAMEWRGR